MSRKTLRDWLDWCENKHQSSIDLGLDRIRVAATRLQLLSPSFPIITVAGTNGKGSTVAMLDAIVRAAGYNTATYTSPHLMRYNERIQYQGRPVSDQLIIDAFMDIERHTTDIELTYFELSMLAAMWVFHQLDVDLVILEVGLGGRLDATNLWDADISIITSIGLDHIEWLGENREVIGREKAGIMRAHRPVVCGDFEPPHSIVEMATSIGAHLYQAGEAYEFTTNNSETWNWSSRKCHFHQLPLPALLGEFQKKNAAAALMAIAILNESSKRLNSLFISSNAINDGLMHVTLAARLQHVAREPEVIVDVAHNAHAATQLAIYLKNQKKMGKTRAVFSILADKDLESVVSCLASVIDEWYVSALDHDRALPLNVMTSTMMQVPKSDQNILLNDYIDINQALDAALANSKPQDRVVIFGSFLVVSELMPRF